jgi:hypothetical protein
MESITHFYCYVVKGNIDSSSTNKIYITSILETILVLQNQGNLGQKERRIIMALPK